MVNLAYSGVPHISLVNILKSCSELTAPLACNKDSKTPVRFSFKASSNNGRKDPNKSMLGRVQTPPT